ncbi:MAG: hypothetical protein Q9163_006429 [Psora crenata]
MLIVERPPSTPVLEHQLASMSLVARNDENILYGRLYHGFIASHVHARLVLHAFMKADLFSVPQPNEHTFQAHWVRSGRAVVYKEDNQTGIPAWSDGDDWCLVGFHGQLRLSRRASADHPHDVLWRKEYHTVIEGVGFGLVAYYTPRAEWEKRDRTLRIFTLMSTFAVRTLERDAEDDITADLCPFLVILVSPVDPTVSLRRDEWDLHLATFTLFEIPFIKELQYGGVEMVISYSCVPRLRETLGPRFIVSDMHNPVAPSAGELNVHGFFHATRRAAYSLLDTAVDTIRNVWPRSAGLCYRDVVVQCGLGNELMDRLHAPLDDREDPEECDECGITLAPVHPPGQTA